ncbi:hypothetical protein [Streptomyces sp. SID3343]|nr:hypothetical protein [Streptomyces sp. SID3343]
MPAPPLGQPLVAITGWLAHAGGTAGAPGREGPALAGVVLSSAGF